MISIIVTIYNQKDTIKRTLASVFNQTSDDFELIIINDGSTDNSEEVIKDFLKDNKVNYYYTENQGVSLARNYGIEKSTKEYVLFLDGDDTIEINLVKYLNSFLDKNYQMICFDYNTLHENKVLKKIIKPKESILIKSGLEILKNNYLKKEFSVRIWNSSVIYKRTFLKKYGIKYLIEDRVTQDINFQLKSLIFAKKVLITNQVLSNYYITRNSITNRFNIFRFDAFYAIKDIEKTIENNEKINKSKGFSSIKRRLAFKKLNGFVYNYTYNYLNFDKVVDSSEISFRKFDKYIKKEYPMIFTEFKKELFKNFFSEFKFKIYINRLFLMTFLLNKKLTVSFFARKYFWNPFGITHKSQNFKWLT